MDKIKRMRYSYFPLKKCTKCTNKTQTLVENRFKNLLVLHDIQNFGVFWTNYYLRLMSLSIKKNLVTTNLLISRALLDFKVFAPRFGIHFYVNVYQSIQVPLSNLQCFPQQSINKNRCI